MAVGGKSWHGFVLEQSQQDWDRVDWKKKGKVLCFRQARKVLDTVEWPLVFIPEGLAPHRVMYSSGVWLSFLQRYSSVALCDEEEFYLINAGL